MYLRALTLALLTLAIAVPAAQAQAPAAPLRIEVLSNRADLISAGDALVAVKYSKGEDPARIRMFAAGKDVTSAFALRPNGRYEGLLTDLALGRNTLVAKLPDGRGARLALLNHPNGGPVFSGPQVQPWKCQDGAKDAQCNAPTVYTFRYQGNDGSWHDYDPKNPPSDVANTTTDQGKTVPFIIRTE